ncbi:uncharacterized protein MONBRDRAFT_32932 [Monosiga brevicollis MX1]|uniref:SH2 domain-containing protein n=1 Tax=Monosiga brevicollis TaxID=81824 RepID=A9V2L8_MONBE|nr:uncharacterized protein MONBRDRAFT_32932 [Monosiga brevicollis MX1]EDQ88398.1 predicted protein [Monosiga brevicollis MX1]|eukprot:XP_001746991.1 hypothetical protein [Monosiga brevicollis MX1]
MTAIPKWTPEQVGQWLQSIELQALKPAFLKNRVDGQLLMELDDEMLQELGLNSKLLRRRLLLKIKDAVAMKLTLVDKSRSRNPTATTPNDQPPATHLTESTYAVPKLLSSTLTTSPALAASATTSPPATPQFASRQRSNLPPPSVEDLMRAVDQQLYVTVESDQVQVPLDTGYVMTDASDNVEAASQPPAASHERSHGSIVNHSDDQYMQLDHQTVHAHVEAAASTSTDAFGQALDHLQGMFSRTPRADLEEALRLSKGSIDTAVDFLLAKAMSDEPAPDSAASQADTAQTIRQQPRSANDWLHGEISREVAEALLKQQGAADGLFLVRRSTSVPGAFVLSLCHRDDILHHIIYAGHTCYQIFDIEADTLEGLIHFLSDFQPQHGWLTPLNMHVPRAASELLINGDDQYASVPGISASMQSRMRNSSVHHRPASTSPHRPPPPQNPPISSPTFSYTAKEGRRNTRAQSLSYTPPQWDAAASSGPVGEPDRQPPLCDLDTTICRRLYFCSLSRLSEPSQECFVKTTEMDMRVLLTQEGPDLGIIAYDEIEQVASESQYTLRVIVSQGRFRGVYYFDTPDAAQLLETIETNKRNAILMEDIRIASLMQNEEFAARVQREPALADIVQTSQSKKSNPAQKSKARAALSRISSRFMRKQKAGRAEGNGFVNPGLNTTGRPTSYSAQVPMHSEQLGTDPATHMPVSFDHEHVAPPPAPVSPGVAGEANSRSGSSASSGLAANGIPPNAVVLGGPVPAPIFEAEFEEDTYGILDGIPNPDLHFGVAAEAPVPYRALRTRQASAYEPGRLTYEAGDVVHVTAQHESGEWQGFCNGQNGYLSSCDVELIVPDEYQPDDVHVEVREPRSVGNPSAPPAFDAPFDTY